MAQPSSIEWLWKSNPNPFSANEPSEWTRYSDIENAIIEEAYQQKSPHALLDDVHIDLQHSVQISNDNVQNQRPIKRIENIRRENPLREARFFPDPIAPRNTFHDLVGFHKIFIDAVMEVFKVPSLQHWDQRKNELVERAKSGILTEGKLIGKHCEAKWLVQQLDQVKDQSKNDIGRCCVRLYSLESFLYKILNQTMRLIGDDNHENHWRSKIETLGPFAFLLHYYITCENIAHRTNAIVYRGAHLTKEMIDEYRRVASSADPRRSFQAFTSCSRNRLKAEQFGNVLFILKPERRISYRTLNMDIAELSAYSDEEEVLIPPGRAFKIESVEFDSKTKKHLIHLTTISTRDKN